MSTPHSSAAEQASVEARTQAPNRVEEFLFGKLPGGALVRGYTLRNARGLRCKLMDYGASLLELHVPDREGRLEDVVLGYSRLEDYLKDDAYVGATIGRVANRIAGASFTLEDKTYQLTTNDGPNHLHGGIRGFDKVIWTALPDLEKSPATVSLNYLSSHGEEGYPGNLRTRVDYTLTDDDELLITYRATADRPTPVNLTNHTYFNLAGKGNILEHQLTVEASRHTPLNQDHLPVGSSESVQGTPFDFRSPAPIGPRLARLDVHPRGFNHNFVLDGAEGGLVRAAKLHDPRSGRVLELLTDQPGLQLYTGHYVKASARGKNGHVHGPNAGLCLEPQHFPNAVNVAAFPSIILKPGQEYIHRTVWKFSTD